MKFLIVTHAMHKKHGDRYYAYSPYVREINLWISKVGEVIIAAPLSQQSVEASIELPYLHDHISFVELEALEFTTWKRAVSSLVKLPGVFMRIITGMHQADHIHLRCPGNMGLLGVVGQVLFPWKTKTAKYAGNWSDYPSQPISYYIQKRLLANTLVSRRLSVLAYCGEQPRSSNVIPFYTASYSENQVGDLETRSLNGPIEFIFVGTLTANKNPIAAVNLIHLLSKRRKVTLHIVGSGPQRIEIENHAAQLGLSDSVTFYGNLKSEDVIRLYKRSHFLILLSDSEGWPKAVAEAMFWGCIPIATKVSCVPWMLGEGTRGILADRESLRGACEEIQDICDSPFRFASFSKEAATWSQVFTLEKFMRDITVFIR